MRAAKVMTCRDDVAVAVGCGNCAMTADRVIGATGFVAALVIYVYYTAWVILRPLLEGAAAGGASRELALGLLPGTYPALAGPTVAGALLFAGVTARVGWELAAGGIARGRRGR